MTEPLEARVIEEQMMAIHQSGDAGTGSAVAQPAPAAASRASDIEKIAAAAAAIGLGAGASRFSEGASRFSEGASRFSEGASRFSAGASRFSAGASRFSAGASRFNAAPSWEHDRCSFSTPSSSYKHNPKGAPARFGSAGRNKHRPLNKDEDVQGGTRLDEDGMVYDMGGACIYFQDRMRQYPFTTGAVGLALLRRLLVVNRRVFALSDARVNATADPRQTEYEGEHLYVMKPTMKAAPKSAGVGTWSDEEYAHAGLQALYLRLKSFQRFTESWALYERACAHGVFDPWLRASEGDMRPQLCVASLGGGPGYELLALAWYLREQAAKRGVVAPRLNLVSLDLQPSWEAYLHALPEPPHEAEDADTYSFAQWDIKAGVDARDAAGCAIDLCLISNVLVYCTDEQSASVLAALLQSGVQAILTNERGGEQKMIGMVERRGVVVVRLLDQSSAAGADDRQLLFLPAGVPVPPPVLHGLEHIFPNVPYEEAKQGV